jgi:hypothetical protein
MTGEDRLRQLMRDPGWSLTTWPDAQARVRRAARRQRLILSSAAAAALVIAAAVLVPVALDGTASPPVAIDHEPRTAHPTPRSSPSRPPTIPPVGSAAFPARIYPPAVKPRYATGALSLCPDPAGLEAPGPATPAAARRVLHQLGRGFRKDLRVSDRAVWPLLASSWQRGGIRLVTRSEQKSVRYSGPLQSTPGVPAALKHAIVSGCGRRVALATWVIVSGPAGNRALEADIFFVTRRGHMLFYRAA